MNRYRHFYKIAQLSIFALTILIIFALVYPIYSYDKKEKADITYRYMSQNQTSAGFDWIADFYKIEKTNGDADVIYITDIMDISKENETKFEDKVIIFEKLFSQEKLNDENNKRLEYVAGVQYLGFWGKTYFNLEDEITMPKEIIKLYEKESGKKWNYYGQGIVLTDGKKVIVLEKGKDYSSNIKIKFNGGYVDYYGYFEITKGSSDSLADFKIKLKDKGKKIFEENQIPAEFPAVYKIQSKLYEGLYFAGDFSNFNTDITAEYNAMPFIMSNKLIFDKYKNEASFFKCYVPIVSSAIKTYNTNKKEGISLLEGKKDKGVAFSTDSTYIYIDDGKNKEKFFVKGANLGPALPGKAFTEFPTDKDIYYEWLALIEKMNLNTVRVYTLLPPEFYQALYEFNKDKDSPIYLLQEIWPEEHPLENNYLLKDYNDQYEKEIEYTIKAIHGDIIIPERLYRANGMYSYDVSDYLMGYLVGRELEPDEVISTDKNNPGYIYDGDYIYSEKGATPTEGWLAKSCDYTLLTEDKLYSKKPLVSIVSWPTLDKLEHNSEWNASGNKTLQYNDKAVVDINNIGIDKGKVSGFFGSYHIYPNYPDFMNNDASYNNYTDEEGRFRYGGYLAEFISGHKKYPALVAEYGISTSNETAHISPDGYNHGGLSEKEQAAGIIRMTKAIIDEKYAGAVIFELIDEWTKKTWTTEYFMIPYNRQMLWHNVLDPEQSYGLLAYEKRHNFKKEIYSSKGSIERVYISQDSSCIDLYIKIRDESIFAEEEIGNANLSRIDFSKDPLKIALSNYELQNSKEPIWEFIIEVAKDSTLKVNPSYNFINGKYVAQKSDFSRFDEMIMMVNKENISKEGYVIPEKKVNLSNINKFVNVEPEASTVNISLPYGLIGVSDPSSRKVLYDPKAFFPAKQDQIGVEESEEMQIRILYKDEIIDLKFRTQAWDEPKYQVREKDSVRILKEFFKDIK